jgi:hypothetical protein
MTELLKSIKADLTDRRILPIVVVVVVALVGAGAYAALSGGSGSSEHSAAVAVIHHPGVTGIAVSQSQNGAGQALAETTNGVPGQRHGAAHDPFVALPGPATVKTATVTTASTGKGAEQSNASSGSGSGSSGSSSKGSSEPSPSSKPTTHSQPKSKTVYKVALQFGQVPGPELVSYPALTKPTPLPSSSQKLIEFLGVSGVGESKGGSGKDATFALAGEVILHGEGVCRPSPTQCSLISLKVGQAEQLEFFSASGPPVTWELRVSNITTDTTTVTTTVTHGLRAQTALLASAGLRWSSQPGVIVWAHPRSHAHSAAHARH